MSPRVLKRYVFPTHIRGIRILVVTLAALTLNGSFCVFPETLNQEGSVKSRDANSSNAEKAFAQAEKLLKEWKAETIRASIKKYEAALFYWQASADQSGQARALKATGDAYAVLSENNKRLNCYLKALRLIRMVRNKTAEVDLLNDVANAYIDLGDSSKAFGFCNQALEMSREIGYRQGEAQSLNITGSAHYAVSDLQKASEILQQAINLWRKLGDHRGQAQTLMNIGYTYDDSGDVHQALDAYTESLQHSREAGDKQGEALALTAIGRIQAWLGENQKALGFHTQALSLFREIGYRNGEAATLNNIGSIYEELGEVKKALDAYSRALRLYQITGQRNYEVLTIGYIGKMYLLSGDKKRAMENFKLKLLISRALSDTRMQAYGLREMGAVFESSGDRSQALDYYFRALKLHLAASDRRGQAYTLNDVGRIYDELGNKPKALSHFKEALQLIKAAGDRGGEVTTLFSIARAERDLGNVNEARLSIESALDSIEFLRTKLVSQDMRSSYFARKHEYYEFYINLLMSMHKQKNSDQDEIAAFEANERARARVLLETLAEAQIDIRNGVDARLIEQERTLQQQINAKAEYNSRLHYNQAPVEQIRKAQDDLEALLDNYHTVQAQIRISSPAYAELILPTPLSMSEIQQHILDANTLLLEYSLGEERSYLWAITQSSINSYELPERKEIERIARDVLDTIAAYQPDQSKRFSEIRLRTKQAESQYWHRAVALSKLLLGPVASQMENKRLLVVPEGILQYVPFAALPVIDATTNRADISARMPLLAKHEIISLPSTSIMEMLRRQVSGRSPAKKAVAVLADPVFDRNDPRVKIVADNSSSVDQRKKRAISNEAFNKRPTGNGPRFARLLSTGREANAVLAEVPQEESMKALGFKASRQTVLSPGMSQYRIVHLATHGVLDTEHPELSAIVLSLVGEDGWSQDGFLRLSEIYNLNLPVELVVLSACSTALGKDIKGEGLVSLMRGFMYAGSPRIVASLWQVDDEATAELMGHFYRKMLKENLPPAAALRSAQIALMNKKQWQAPYFWASFIIQGEWN